MTWKDDWKHIGSEIYSGVQKKGFWILILIMLGIAGGVTASKTYFNKIVDDAVILQKFIHKGKVYYITPTNPIDINGNLNIPNNTLKDNLKKE